MKPQHINPFHNPSAINLKKSFFLSWSGFIVACPGFQFAGQTSPFISENLNASINLKVSCTDLPTLIK